MSAKVFEVTLFQAYCLDCGWEGDQVESERTAITDAAEHDEEEHRTEEPPK